MSRRWVRFVAAVAVGIAVTLPQSGVAVADPTQSLVSRGSSDAAARGTTAGIAIVDRVTGHYADNGTNAHLRFGSASLVKLFIADSVLRRARLGQIHLTSADQTALTRMLRSSDDTAASSFWSRFGSNSIVSDVAGRYHLTETSPPANPRYWGLTQVTAHDLAYYYRGMLAGQGGLASADRDFIMAQLRASTSHGIDGYYQWFGLHDGLPREPILGVKQGWMCCFSDGYIWRHSTGFVGPDARYIVVVLTRDRGSLGSAHTATSATHAVQTMFTAGLVPRVQDAIGDRWYALGGPTSGLGLPSTSQVAVSGGAYSRFQRGVLYWSPTTGAHAVAGAILNAWAVQGYERGLGFPLVDDTAVPGGVYGRFQRGVIYWSATTGAHTVAGAILNAWAASGYERGLGFPLIDDTAVPGGVYGRFQRGVIYWSATTGAHAVSGAILTAWDAAGGAQGALGFPTDDAHPVAEGTRVDFQHGSLTLTPTGQVVRVDTPPSTSAARAAGAGTPAAGSGTTATAPSTPAAAPTTAAPSPTADPSTTQPTGSTDAAQPSASAGSQTP